MSEQKSFWLDDAVQKLDSKQPQGELIVSSGVSPSGPYHIGHLRELLTADAIAWGLRQIGRNARHIHFVDDMDGLRKVPAGLPADFDKHIGVPLYLAPAPDGSGRSYSQYYFDEIHEAMGSLGAQMEVVYSHQRYQEGYFSESIEAAIEQLDEVKAIIEEVSGRQLPKHWLPVEVQGDEQVYLNGISLDSIDKESKTLSVMHEGTVKTVSYATGKVKLNWRIDWPARWALLPVAAEPFGRDHATKGGSYDTGAALIKKIFNAEPPEPYPYEFINLKGQTKKMSASEGTGITPLEALQVMPAAALKDFILKDPPRKQLFFDVGQGFARGIDEYADMLRENSSPGNDINRANLSLAGTKMPNFSTISFAHLAVVYQTAQKDDDAAINILVASEDESKILTQQKQILETFPLIDVWLSKWAPEKLQFSVQKSLPSNIRLSEGQREFLAQLADDIAKINVAEDAEWYHKLIYAKKELCDLTPKQSFEAIYLSILGKDHGPKAGWFLSTFDPGWLSERLKEAAGTS